MVSPDPNNSDGAPRDLKTPLNRALQQLLAKTGVSLAFGGPVTADGSVKLECFAGRTIGALPGVELMHGEGLGGKAAAVQSGITVNDYFDARTITHRYDPIIRAEGLRSLVAVPVIVNRGVVGMMYGAFRTFDIIGGRIERAVGHEARALEQALVARYFAAPSTAGDDLEVTRLREQLRETHRSIRALANRASESDVRKALDAIAERLFSATSGSGHRTADVIDAGVTAREKEVLQLAGAGLSNQMIADVLGLSLHTVKSYMKSAMSKLNSRTRLEAVVAARSNGLIP
ncbi:helix-turn-helix transcriptional regulator [Paenarthrobacter ureafaciens]|uniref:helix-turn-helix transcriptional regulator n=1 Tax=Paenarthrobacter ureafaciens TaxID=37931 RepID=UPI0015BE7716|nr:LuxR C-terminal-related transcriptional regulator [Paenarthrobacter ureafaciens]MEC3854107.1 LuxR C-terminal-related transcriptional regulator [Paenarthrobacter ureafaciens]